MTTHPIRFLPWFLAGLLPLNVSADGLLNPPAGASALGRFGGHIAYTADASAATHNPANLVELPSRSVLASLTFGYSKSEYTGPSGFGTESEDPWAVLPSLFMADPGPEGRNWAWGLALTSPYGRSTRLDENGPFRYTAPYFTQLASLNLAPAVSVRVTDRLSLGFAVNVLWSQLDLRQKYPWFLVAGNPALPDGKTYFEADGVGLGASAAATLKLSGTQRLAATVRSPLTVDYEGELEITNIPPGAPGAPTSDFETEITFPLEIAVAYGIQVTERLLLEANVDWTRHSDFDKLELDAGVNTPLLPSPEIRTDWEDNWSFGASLAYRLNPQWVLRAGYVYLETPIPSETMLPTTSEEDQGVVSVGFGYRGERHHLDVAYAIGLFDGRTITDSDNPSFNGDYDFESHLVSLAYGCDF